MGWCSLEKPVGCIWSSTTWCPSYRNYSCLKKGTTLDLLNSSCQFAGQVQKILNNHLKDSYCLLFLLSCHLCKWQIELGPVLYPVVHYYSPHMNWWKNCYCCRWRVELATCVLRGNVVHQNTCEDTYCWKFHFKLFMRDLHKSLSQV